MDVSTILWLLMVAGGPALIGIVIAYALFRRRRLSPAEKAAQHDGVDRVYERRQ